MKTMRRILHAMRAIRNPDLKWVGHNLAPKMNDDWEVISRTLHMGRGFDRGFSFDGRDIAMSITWLPGGAHSVSLNQIDVPGLTFTFPVKDGKRYFPASVQSDGISDQVFDEVAARLRAFGEAYLADPISHFNHATPGEYTEWPKRDIVEPPRDPSAMPMSEVDAEVDRRIRAGRISERMSGPDAADARAAQAEMDEIRNFRMENLAKTTHGRWLVRNQPGFFDHSRTTPDQNDTKGPSL